MQMTFRTTDTILSMADYNRFSHAKDVFALSAVNCYNRCRIIFCFYYFFYCNYKLE